MYIPSKPAKYGIKIWWVNDSKSYYPFQGQLYTGLSASGVRDVGQGERVIRDLVIADFKGSGRNVTCDNFFTTFDLAKHLMENNLSILGTVNKKRRFIPAEMMPHQTREIFSTEFGHSDNVVLCSYVPKKNKAVVLWSTYHYDFVVHGEDKKMKPAMIVDYNQTKEGTDTMDQMLGYYTCHRKTRRWTEAIFYNLIDVAGLASFIIYQENTRDMKLEKRKFIKHWQSNFVCLKY